jgi:hypothetical protein
VVDQSRGKLLALRIVERRLRISRRAPLIAILSTDTIKPEIRSIAEGVTRLSEDQVTCWPPWQA